jgi:hypothetical protein
MSLAARKLTRIPAAEYLAVGLTIIVSSLQRGIDFDDPAPPPGT